MTQLLAYEARSDGANSVRERSLGSAAWRIPQMPGFRLLGLALVTLMLAGLTWGFHRADTLPSLAPTEIASKPTTPSLSAAPPQPGEQALAESRTAAAFATAPFASMPLLAAPLEPTLGKNLSELMKPPPGNRQDPPPLDPRKLRALMDRGVVMFATAADDKKRQTGAELIQTAALLGFSPARSLLARNYPLYEPVRRVVPARDVISYILDFFSAAEIDSEASKPIFISLGEQFAREGQIEFFATHLVEGLRGDNRPQLSHRIDAMMELLARVPGACLAVAQVVSQPVQTAGDACSMKLAEDLRRFIETGRPIEREPDLRRRGLIMLDQAGH